MKVKTRRIIIAAVLIVLALYAGIVRTDYNRIADFPDPPRFAKQVEVSDERYTFQYEGVGYTMYYGEKWEPDGAKSPFRCKFELFGCTILKCFGG